MPAGRQVEEGLQLVIDAENHHIPLPKRRKQAVEHTDEQRGQRKVQHGRHPDCIEPAGPAQGPGAARRGAAAQRPPDEIHRQIDAERDALPKARCKRRPPNAERRAGPEAEDQHGVQNDVGDAAAKQRGHRRFHPANGLENLFKRKAKHDDGAKRKDNRAVFNPECGEGGLSRKKAAESPAGLPCRQWQAPRRGQTRAPCRWLRRRQRGRAGWRRGGRRSARSCRRRNRWRPR